MIEWLSFDVIAHLWQSTLFVGIVWLATLALRRHVARVRCWLWTAASVKFLVPLSWLMSFGAQFEWRAAPAIAQPAATFVMEEILAPPVVAAVTSTATAQPTAFWPWVMASLWAMGFVGVVFWWWRQWCLVRGALRQAKPVELGPGYDIEGLTVLSSPWTFEPGVVGIWRPVLLLPDGLAERLSSAQLNAVIAHERCHIRNHDNLAAGLQMLVEALFWFHPLVWWVERRLIDERERACDEAVLRSGSHPSDYAEGILAVCRLSVPVPLACVSGVTGSDLRRRIEFILRGTLSSPMSAGRRYALVLTAVAAVALPIVVGAVNATPVAAAQTQNLAGQWQGSIADKEQRLVFVLAINSAGGGYTATMHRIDQVGRPVAASVVTQGSTVRLSVPTLEITFEGKLALDGNSIAGMLTEGQASLPLTLVRASKETAWALPTPRSMAADAPTVFEVATVKPAAPPPFPGFQLFTVRGPEVLAINTTTAALIRFAYGVQTRQVSGGPSWIENDRFDVTGRPQAEGVPNNEQMRGLIKSLLVDRFKLAVHTEKRDLPAYLLTVGKQGHKLTQNTSNPNGLASTVRTGLGVISATNANMGHFAALLQSSVLDRPVVDRTGLPGRFDFMLNWTPDQSPSSAAPTTPPDPNAPPGFFTAIQEQLGLRIESQTAPVDVIVIDRIERPSDN
jgi:uncharacterized protein (TIGR03435 family)